MTVSDPADLTASIRGVVEAGLGVGELHAILIAFAAAGGLQQDAEMVLSELVELWADSDPERADLVRDVWDYVVGWCQIEHRIWPMLGST